MKKKPITEDSYIAIKHLLSAGVHEDVVAKTMDTSRTTIYRVQESLDWADWVRRKEEFNAKQRAERAALRAAKKPAEEKTVKDEKPAQPELTSVQTLIALERIAGAVERLADAWEATPEPSLVKRGIFSR